MSELSILEFSSDVASAEAPPPLPVGEYTASIKGVEQKVSSTTGKDYLSVALVVSPDDYPADFDTDRDMFPDGVTLQYNRLVAEDSARARYNMRKWCEAIGAKMGKQIDPNDWLGLSVKVKIKHEKYEGEDRAQIGGISAAA